MIEKADGLRNPATPHPAREALRNNRIHFCDPENHTQMLTDRGRLYAVFPQRLFYHLARQPVPRRPDKATADLMERQGARG
jgi:hypothetical protein